jgi:hypothetical protein
MPVHEYAIRDVHGLWEIRLDGRLTSSQPTQRAALLVADALVYAAALRGKRSRILVGDLDGTSIEFPVIGPASPA